MTIAELRAFVGQNVYIYFKGCPEPIYGKLGFVDEFSAKHCYRKTGYFYIGNMCFKVSCVRKVIRKEEKSC